MASKRRLRRNHCDGKRRFATKADARRAASFGTLPYRCHVCHGFHVGHRAWIARKALVYKLDKLTRARTVALFALVFLAACTPLRRGGLPDADMQAWEREAEAIDQRARALTPPPLPPGVDAATVDDCPKGTQAGPVLRPDASDVSLAVMNSTGHGWFRGCTATQADMRALEDESLSRMPELFAFCDALPKCDLSRRKATYAGMHDRYKAPTRDVMKQFWLTVPYDDTCGDDCTPSTRTSGRTEKTGGDTYGTQTYAQRDAQSQFTSTANKAACAAMFTPSIGALAGVTVVNGVCVRDTTTKPPPPKESYASQRRSLGMNDARCAGPFDPATKTCRTRLAYPPTTEREKSLLDATTDAHLWVVEYECGFRSDAPPPGIVDTKHREYEQTCDQTDNPVACRTFRSILRFTSRRDPRHTQRDKCVGLVIAHDFHHLWHACQTLGDQACSDRSGKAHMSAHVLLADASQNYMLRAVGEPKVPVTLATLMSPRSKHPNVTVRQWIDEYLSGHPALAARLAQSSGAPL